MKKAQRPGGDSTPGVFDVVAGFPFAKAGQDRRFPWVTEICELGFLLEMSWGMISPK